MFLKGVLLNNLYRNINVKPGHFTGNFSEVKNVSANPWPRDAPNSCGFEPWELSPVSSFVFYKSFKVITVKCFIDLLRVVYLLEC